MGAEPWLGAQGSAAPEDDAEVPVLAVLGWMGTHRWFAPKRAQTRQEWALGFVLTPSPGAWNCCTSLCSSEPPLTIRPLKG